MSGNTKNVNLQTSYLLYFINSDGTFILHCSISEIKMSNTSDGSIPSLSTEWKLSDSYVKIFFFPLSTYSFYKQYMSFLGCNA